jgi:hypothetical protein
MINIVIVGNSPVSTLVAWLLDQNLARHTHLRVSYLSEEPELVYYPKLDTILGRNNWPSKKQLLGNVSFLHESVRSINLAAERIITADRQIEFDLLFIDQTPILTSAQLKTFSQASARLVNEIQARLKTGHKAVAQVRILGPDISSYQAALALSEDIKKLELRLNIGLVIEPPDQPKLRAFLQSEGLKIRSSGEVSAGFSLACPTSPVNNQAIHGLHLDKSGRAITNQWGSLDNHPQVFILDSDATEAQNLLRVQLTLAKQIVANLERKLDHRQLRVLEWPKSACLLKGWQIGSLTKIDLAFYRKIQRLG